MANQEKNTSNPQEQLDEQALEQAGSEQRERLREHLERNQEREPTTSVETARAEALEHATKSEREPRQEKERQDVTKREQLITKKDKERSFNATMQEARSQMSPASRTFSKIIHQPAVEKTSEFIGNTVARPNAILSGSLFAFLFTATFYLIARFNGYPLSGSETIASFVAGWLVGIIFDYLRLLIVGKK